MSPSRRRLLGLSVAILAVGGLGAGIYWRLKPEAAADPTATSIVQAAVPNSAAGLAGDIAIPVSGARAVRGTLVISVSASGQAEASQRTVITPQVAGRIRSVAASENRAVSAGQTLLEIDPIESQMKVDEAQVQVRNAQAKYEETTLFDDRITDPQVRAERQRNTRSQSGLDAAELNLRRAQMELERTRVAAPIAGRVANVKVVPGEWVTASTEVMTIVDLDPIRVDVQVLEGEIGFLAVGRAAHVSFAAFPGETFQGRIQTINPLVEPGTRTSRVTLLVPNPAGRILPGMYARVSLEAREFPNRVMVPRAAILERDRRTMLFVFEGDEAAGRAKWRYVTTGLENERDVEILGNVATDSVRAGEVVLTDGHYTLIHDAKVRMAGTP